tara:strand:+ start:2082 stop:2258 length:177 start_codon:yes stop_codon:yes gene_type:complete
MLIIIGMLNKKGEINMEMMIESKLAELELSKGSPIEIHEKIKEELFNLLLAFYYEGGK